MVTTVQITDPVRRFVTCLQIVSSILRNSELVEDAQLKRDAYDAIAGYWCELLIAVLVAVDFMDENSQELEALRHLLPLGNPSLVGYFLKIFAPTVIINVALECLGTAKLQLIMEDSILRAKDTAKQVLSAFLYTDLRLPKRLEYLELLLNKHKGHRFTTELIFFKVVQLFAFAKLSQEDEAEIRRLLAKSVDVVVSADSQVERNQLKNRVLADLEKKRLTQIAPKAS